MSKARDIADLGGVTTRLDQVGNSDGALSNRNRVLNGSMAVAQRGTSFTSAGTQYTLDRFKTEQGGIDNALINVTQDNDAPSGFAKSLKVTVATAETAVADNEYMGLVHLIEARGFIFIGILLLALTESLALTLLGGHIRGQNLLMDRQFSL